jgi:hypothetical protein
MTPVESCEEHGPLTCGWVAMVQSAYRSGRVYEQPIAGCVDIEVTVAVVVVEAEHGPALRYSTRRTWWIA